MPLFSRLPRSASSDRVTPHNHNVLHTLKRVVSSQGISMSSSTPEPAPTTASSTAELHPINDSEEMLSFVRENNVQAVVRCLNKNQSRSGNRLNFLGSPKAKRCNINYQLKNGMSALHQAAFNGAVPMMHVLLDHGAKVDLRDSRGLTPMHVASFQGHFEAVQLLLKCKSEVNVRAHNGLSPLHLAAQNGHYDVMKLLLINNAEVYSRTDDGRTAFDVACEHGRFSIVQLLLSMKADNGLQQRSTPQDKAVPRSKFSCFHLASRNGHVDVLRLLLSQPDVDVNKMSEVGTCLHLAVAAGHLNVVKLLLECGIDPSLVNGFGQTAKDLINRTTPHSRELHQILTERLSASEAVALRDYCDLTDPNSIAFRSGEHITVLEQSSSSSMWKGFVTREGMSRTGYFPSSMVQLHTNNYSSTNLVPCSVPHVDPSESLNAAGNRNSSASVDSGRGSAHTAASSSESVHSRNGTATTTNNGYSNGMPRQSVVSTCSSGSLGSIPDDQWSDASPEAMPAYSPSDWDHLGPCQQVLAFLNAAQFGIYYKNFEDAGYDLVTMIRMTPEDLNAIGLTNPKHRKRLRLELTRLAHAMANQPNWTDPLNVDGLQLNEAVGHFTRALSLPDSCERQLSAQGFATVGDLKDLTWEDLEEIGISKLGYQKKLILAVERLRRHESPATLRRCNAGTQISNTTCTTTAIVHPQAAAPIEEDTYASPIRMKPVAKITGQQVSLPPPPPPLPEPLKIITTRPKIPPPPPKRSTSVKLSQSPCASPKHRGSNQHPHQGTSSYENVTVIENAIRELGTAQSRQSVRPHRAEPIPFANENCGTIRHKPLETVPECSRSPTPSRICLPHPPLPYQTGQSIELRGNHHLTESPRLPPRRQDNSTCNKTPAAVESTQSHQSFKRELEHSLRPSTTTSNNRESCISNLDDICDMLSDLQSILDKELQERS